LEPRAARVAVRGRAGPRPVARFPFVVGHHI